jgi:hypothetical protein
MAGAGAARRAQRVMRQPFNRPPRERALAWLYTGPLGHLWGTLADIAELWARWAAASARGRLGR